MQYLKRLLVEVAFYNKFPRNISEIFPQETFLLVFSSTNNKILLIACFLPSQTLKIMTTKVSVRVSTEYDRRIELLNVFSRDRQLQNICRRWKMPECQKITNYSKQDVTIYRIFRYNVVFISKPKLWWTMKEMKQFECKICMKTLQN